MVVAEVVVVLVVVVVVVVEVVVVVDVVVVKVVLIVVVVLSVNGVVKGVSVGTKVTFSYGMQPEKNSLAIVANKFHQHLSSK